MVAPLRIVILCEQQKLKIKHFSWSGKLYVVKVKTKSFKLPYNLKKD